ncbi:MAG: hypothetical protein U0270_17545 [Labilithrix sp.]
MAVLLSWGSTSRADGLEGKWRQTALREDFTVQNWLESGCGPAPKSSTTGGGEVVEVRAEGDELVFVGGGRVYRTNACYDPMPNLQRGSHSRDANGKSWRTRCTTAPNDPRSAVLNTLVNASTERHIDLVETGRYEITLEGGKCVADIKRTRSFDRVDDGNAPAPASAPSPKEPKPAPAEPAPRPALCGIVGEPQKLEVRPSRKLLRPGETFRLRGVVLDAKGCETKTALGWKLPPEASASGVKVDAFGNVTASKDAGEGTLEIIASAGGRETRMTVEIVSASRYDELLSKSGLNAAGENEDASTVTIASQSLGTDDARVEDHSRQRRFTFLGIVGVALVGLVITAVVLARRGRRAKELLAEAEVRHEEKVRAVLERRKKREAEHASQMRAHEESVAAARAISSSNALAAIAAPPSTPAVQRAALACASCGREMEPGTSFCPHDGTPLVAAPSTRDVTRTGGGGICPVCNTVYGDEVTLCPTHKAKLIRARAPAPLTAQQRGKICPTCGERFEGGADFCGKDGTQLVLLN